MWFSAEEEIKFSAGNVEVNRERGRSHGADKDVAGANIGAPPDQTLNVSQIITGPEDS